MKKLKFLLPCMIFVISIYGNNKFILNTIRNDSIKFTYPDSVYSQDSTLTLQNVYNEIIKDSIQYPEIVLKQVIFETGWLKSDYCINRHNLFGFKGKNGYMYFDSWQASVLYYKKWQNRHYKGGSYYDFLIRIKYAANTREYVEYLKKIKIPDYIFSN